MAFHIPFNQRASAQGRPEPIYIGFDIARPPRKKFNWWGFNGMWMSVASLVSAGFLSPVPLLVSLVGLRRPGKKMASIGTLVSLMGVALASTIVLTVVSDSNHRAHAQESRAVQKQVAKTHKLLAVASKEISEFRDDNQGYLPDDIDGNMLVIKHIDQWGESLRFDSGTNEGIIRSAGPDHKFNTRDDVTLTIKGKGDADPLLPVLLEKQ